MTINTTFNVGDKVYYLRDSVIATGIIEYIKIPFIESNFAPTEIYFIEYSTRAMKCCQLFKTKADLINSL